MIRDIFFEVPNAERAEALITLCEAEGWTVDREQDIHHYEQGVTVELPHDLPSYVAERTYTSVTAHKPDFDYDEINAVQEKADELAAKVGGECTGGGCAIGPGDYTEPQNTIEWVEDAQPILDIINAPVIDTPLVSIRDMAMQIRERLLAAGWSRPGRVFLEGDEVPSHLPVINNYGMVNDDHEDWDESDGEVYTANYANVEFTVDWEAAVARAKQERGI